MIHISFFLSFFSFFYLVYDTARRLALHPSIKLSLPELPADAYLDRLCDRLDEEMQRWGVLYHSEVLGLYLQKAGWIGLCMAFQQKGQAASLMQKLYQSPLFSESARSFVMNHVGAVINTYVVTALERQRFHEHRRCVEAQGLGVRLDRMEDWDAFEEDIPTDDEEREVVNPYHPSRQKRSPITPRFGSVMRNYQTYFPAVRQASVRGSFGGARPRTNSGTRTRPVAGGAVGGAKKNPPHVQTVQTKSGKQVDVNNIQNYVSAKIPQGAIPLQKPNNVNAGVPAPASPPAPSTKIQPSSNPWGLPSSILPGSVVGKTAGLSSSKSAPVLSSNSVKSAPTPLKRSDSSNLSQKSGSGKPNANANAQPGNKTPKSSGTRT